MNRMAVDQVGLKIPVTGGYCTSRSRGLEQTQKGQYSLAVVITATPKAKNRGVDQPRPSSRPLVQLPLIILSDANRVMRLNGRDIKETWML